MLGVELAAGDAAQHIRQDCARMNPARMERHALEIGLGQRHGRCRAKVHRDAGDHAIGRAGPDGEA